MTVAEEARQRGISRTRVYRIRRRAAGVCVRCGATPVTKTLCVRHQRMEAERHKRNPRILPEWSKEKKRKYMRARRLRPGQLERERAHKLAKYGLTAGAFDRLYESQGKCCAICGDETPGKALHIDHCHVTGKVRGLLCTRCNPGLGYFRESVALMRKAIQYLERQ